MPSYYDSKSRFISLTKNIASSGEGAIWETDRPGCLGKIYHTPNLKRVEKLKVMVANQPKDPTSSQNHVSIAWPQELLKDKNGDCVGFLMPAITNAKELIYSYNPSHRQKFVPRFNWYCLHAISLNVASIIQALHEKNYIVGDMKSQNILVNDRSLVSVIDTDSFQITDPNTGKVYRCPVGSEGFTPPELLGKDLSDLTQTRSHDRFRLAVIIHHLLFGYHPFTGKWTGCGDSPEPDELIRQGLWLYNGNSKLQSTQRTIPLDIVHPEIKKLFLKCFNDGHKNPSYRPSAKDWCDTLQVAIYELKSCRKIPNHIYNKAYGKCYWCERFNTLKVDIFPHVSNVIKPPARPPVTMPPRQVSSPPIRTPILPTKINLSQRTTTGSTPSKYTSKSGKRLQKLGIYGWIFPATLVIGTISWVNRGFIAGEYFYLWGTEKLRRSEYQEAIENYDKAVQNNPKIIDRVNPNRGKAYYTIGLNKSEKEEYSEAIEDFIQALQNNPFDSNTKLQLANTYYNRGLKKADKNDDKGAIEDYTQSIDLEPNNSAFYFNRGNAHYELKNYQESIDDYQKALSNNYNKDTINQKLALVYYYRGLDNANNGRHRAAIEDFSQAIQINHSESAYSNRGASHLKLGNYQEVINDYTQAINFNSNSALYYNERGNGYYGMGNYRKALDDYEKAIQNNSRDPIIYSNRGDAHEKLGNNLAAIDDYQKAADIYSKKGGRDEYQKQMGKIEAIKSRQVPSSFTLP